MQVGNLQAGKKCLEIHHHPAIVLRDGISMLNYDLSKIISRPQEPSPFCHGDVQELSCL